VTAIAGKPIADVMALVEPLAPRDNPSNLLAYGPLYMRQSELLAGVGVIDREGPAVFSVVGRDGTAKDVTVEPILAADDIVWTNAMPHVLPQRDVMWLKDAANPMWWRVLDDSRALYLQYNQVDSTSTIADEVLARLAEGGVDRVVVDLRNNGGGDNHRYVHLLEALQDPLIDRPGRLYVLIGRLTFSAAGNFATEVEAKTGAIFVGEDMGSSPNLYGDVRKSPMRTIGLDVYIASIYWQKSTPDDPRITIEPDLPVPYSSADYFSDRDPVLDAALGAVVGL
jgi:C-terminal processing protease CtpA/Prc